MCRCILATAENPEAAAATLELQMHLETLSLNLPLILIHSLSLTCTLFSFKLFFSLSISRIGLNFVVHQEIFEEAMTAATIARTEAVGVEEGATPLELCSASASFLLLASFRRLSSACRLRSSLCWRRHLQRQITPISIHI